MCKQYQTSTKIIPQPPLSYCACLSLSVYLSSTNPVCCFVHNSLHTLVAHAHSYKYILMSLSHRDMIACPSNNSFINYNFHPIEGHIHSFGGPGDEANLTACLHRIIDLEEADKETIHLLVFLLMQFLSRADQAFPTEEKPLVKTQTIVLRHLYLLLGYSQIDRSFHITSARLRSSAVFNVFLTNLTQVLDQNHLMGWCIIQAAFQVLLYAPSRSNGITSGPDTLQNLSYTFSLWFMEPHARRNWLMSVVVIMYKYQYTQPPYSGYINNLVRIILNSLESHFHQC